MASISYPEVSLHFTYYMSYQYLDIAINLTFRKKHIQFYILLR